MPIEAPVGLAEAGCRLWLSIAQQYNLRADEVAVLERAARLADEEHRLAAALATSDVTVSGSKGQVRPHPLLAELRSTRALLATLLKQLDLPEQEGKAADAADTSARASKAARARWDRRRLGGNAG